LRDFCTTRGLAISWLIVGMSAFTFYSCETGKRLRKFSIGTTSPIRSPHAN
jgi:hypothetical protein